MCNWLFTNYMYRVIKEMKQGRVKSEKDVNRRGENGYCLVCYIQIIRYYVANWERIWEWWRIQKRSLEGNVHKSKLNLFWGKEGSLYKVSVNRRLLEHGSVFTYSGFVLEYCMKVNWRVRRKLRVRSNRYWMPRVYDLNMQSCFIRVCLCAF